MLVDRCCRAGLDAGDVARVLTVQSDAATARLIDFALERHGPAPVPWAWLALGSVARRELTLASDQDNALAYADGGGPEADAYFATRRGRRQRRPRRAAASGADHAERAGARPALADDRRALGRGASRRASSTPTARGLVRAAVSFDFRHVGGGLPIVAAARGDRPRGAAPTRTSSAAWRGR